MRDRSDAAAVGAEGVHWVVANQEVSATAAIAVALVVLPGLPYGSVYLVFWIDPCLRHR